MLILDGHFFTRLQAEDSVVVAVCDKCYDTNGDPSEFADMYNNLWENAISFEEYIRLMANNEK